MCQVRKNYMHKWPPPFVKESSMCLFIPSFVHAFIPSHILPASRLDSCRLLIAHPACRLDPPPAAPHRTTPMHLLCAGTGVEATSVSTTERCVLCWRRAAGVLSFRTTECTCVHIYNYVRPLLGVSVIFPRSPVSNDVEGVPCLIF